MKHKWPRVISHEFFGVLVIVRGENASPGGIGLLRRGWDRQANDDGGQRKKFVCKSAYTQAKSHGDPHRYRLILGRPTE
jgi:hypothetical protein